MTKARKQITIDARVAEQVDRNQGFNLSGWVNRMLHNRFDPDSDVVFTADLQEAVEHIEEAEKYLEGGAPNDPERVRLELNAAKKVLEDA